MSDTYVILNDGQEGWGPPRIIGPFDGDDTAAAFTRLPVVKQWCVQSQADGGTMPSAHVVCGCHAIAWQDWLDVQNQWFDEAGTSVHLTTEAQETASV